MTHIPGTVKIAALLLILALFAVTAPGCGSAIEYDENGRVIIPVSVDTVKQNTLELAVSGGISLNGKWGEWHKEMIASGKGRRFDGYITHLDNLTSMLESGKVYRIDVIYTDDPEADEYKISMSVSTSNRLVPFKSPVEANDLMKQALAGKAAAEATAHYNDEGEHCWRAYAPVYDAESTVIAIISLEYPASVIMSYPEWNRDDKKWNGYTGSTPSAVATEDNIWGRRFPASIPSAHDV